MRTAKSPQAVSRGRGGISLRQLAVVTIVVAISLPLAWAEGDQSTAQPCPGYFYWDGVGNVCPHESGMYEVMSPDGTRSLGFISHTDPIPVGDDPMPPLIMSSSDVECVTSSEAYAIWVIYARANNDADGYSARVPTIRDLVAQSQQYISNTAAAGGGSSKLKVLCDPDGQVTVKNEVLPTSLSGDSFSSIVNDLTNKGYNDGKKKYWVYYDDTGACGCAGTGHIYFDSSASASNYNNGNYPDPFFAVDFGYNNVRTMLHELSHNLGGVQNGAPAYSGNNYGHCVDGKDILCYDDGGGNTGSCVDFYCSGTCSTEVWDCQRNTYYNLAPASGSWLASHWNIGGSYVRFLRHIMNVAPTMTALSCSPTSALIGDTINCSFTATDTTDQLAYNLNWGDGTTERLPASGFVASGTTLSSSHAYGTDAIFTVSVSATDNNATNPLTGSAITRTIAIQAAPIMSSVSCSPNPVEVARTLTCSFAAADNSTGVYYNVSWGDGSPIERVPATGFVAPGTTRTAQHAFSATGPYTVGVTATDNGSPALSSGTLTTGITVNANVAPSMTDLSCTPSPAQEDYATTCSFRASDAYGQLFYTLDWGDGSPTQRVPATGKVNPGVMQTASKTFGTAGSYTISATATDDGSPALTSSARTLGITVDPNVAPAMTTVSCTTPAQEDLPSTCSFRATDNIGALYYTVDWGDGSPTQRVPASGTVAPGTTLSASKTFTVAGTYTVSATATDDGAPALTSSPMTTSVNVAANPAPIMTELTCSPNPVQALNPTTCTFRATDTLGAIFYTIDWGDGSPTQRVPASGTVAPGTSQSATKTFGQGNYTVSVTATDNGSPPITSVARTTLLIATFENIAPVMQSASCNPSTAYQQATCSVRATDTDSSAVKYTIQWGDGTTSVVPATGYTAANVSFSTGHVYSAPGTYTMNVTATDNGSPAKTSNTISSTVTIGPDITPPTLTVNEPRGGRLYQGCGLVTFVAASMDPTFLSRGCVKAAATDPSGVANVTVRINGVVVAVDSVAPYDFEFPIMPGLDADLAITAYDVRGNARTTTMRVDMV